MSVHKWDQYGDNDVYSDDHEIEEDIKIQDELENESTPQVIPQSISPRNDFNSYRQRSLHEHFKGGSTHVAQSRLGKYHQKRRAPRNLMISVWNPQSIVQTDRSTDISETLKKT